jgi:protein tyrosine phosphatase (PTP) superfamily phosphohydrolase (DUF442 family)
LNGASRLDLAKRDFHAFTRIKVFDRNQPPSRSAFFFTLPTLPTTANPSIHLTGLVLQISAMRSCETLTAFECRPTTAKTSQPDNVVRQRRPWRRYLSVGLAIVAVPLAIEGYRVSFGGNFHAVVPGRIYRCAQPTEAAVKEAVAQYGIRTIVNLRGSSDTFPWYLEESRATHDCNISQEDVCFSAGRLPATSEVRRFIEVLDHSEYPILMHCRRGADRTGIAAVIAVLLTTETSLADARSQLGLRFGHLALGRPGQLDLMFDFYEDWLKGQGKAHSKEVFRDWALHHYCPGTCWCELTLVQPPPAAVQVDEPVAIRVRSKNTSLGPWTLKPQWWAGVHMGCHIYDEQDYAVGVVKAGLRDGFVAPGESADFTMVVPALKKPGRYRLILDMTDEQQCWFFQMGSTPLELELIVRE